MSEKVHMGNLRTFLVVWVILSFFSSPQVDVVSHRYLWPARAIVEQRSFSVTDYTGSELKRDLVFRNGDWYSVTAPGCSLLLAPGMAVWKHIYPHLPSDQFQNLHERFYVFGQIFLVILVIAPGAALATVLLRKILLEEGLSQRRAFWIALCLPLGTHVIYYATRIYAHSWALALLIAGWGMVLQARRTGRATAGYSAGFLMAGAYMFDYMAFWPTLAAFLFIGGKRRVQFAIGAVLPVAAMLVYHTVVHGAPLRTGYHYVDSGEPSTIPFSGPWFRAYEWKDFTEALWGITFGMRGLVYVAPVALLLPTLLRSGAGKNARAAGATFFLVFAFNLTLRHGLWVGGTAWGARQLVLGIPFLLLAVAPSLNRLSFRTFGLLLGVSFFINWIGVQYGPGVSVLELVAYFFIAGPTSPLFRWLFVQHQASIVPEHLAGVPLNSSGHYWAFSHISPLGAYLVLILLVAAIVLGPGGRRQGRGTD